LKFKIGFCRLGVKVADISDVDLFGDKDGHCGLKYISTNGHPSGGPWRQFYCTQCQGYVLLPAQQSDWNQAAGVALGVVRHSAPLHIPLAQAECRIQIF
jgi:hypothetical protein